MKIWNPNSPRRARDCPKLNSSSADGSLPGVSGAAPANHSSPIFDTSARPSAGSSTHVTPPMPPRDVCSSRRARHRGQQPELVGVDDARPSAHRERRHHPHHGALVKGVVPPGKASTAAVKPCLGRDRACVRITSPPATRCWLQAVTTSDLKTAARFAHPWFGPLDAFGWLAMAAGHMGIHRVQIGKNYHGLAARTTHPK